jgi:hypothetical protein
MDGSDTQAYRERARKVVYDPKRFSHVMALALDSGENHTRGLIRCVTRRDGDVAVAGFIDRSELHYITSSIDGSFSIDERVRIEDEQKIISSLTPKGWECIGLEDPDLWRDESGTLHLYFTIPIMSPPPTRRVKVHLGHAQGPDLHSLRMTPPVLKAKRVWSAKELSIAPKNTRGLRLNLIESHDKTLWGTSYSTVQVAVAEHMEKDWKYGRIAFHPKNNAPHWISGHASPGPLFPTSFINLGGTRMLGIMNGREANIKRKKITKYGIFSIGLFIYDYEHGQVEWVSPKPFIQDSEARTITFASQFVETESGKGVLYAHIDDSFVRAYNLDAESIKRLIPS